MACTGETVAAHSAVVAILVGGLSERSQTHNYVARTDVGVVDHVAALHSACHGRIHDDGSYKVAHISSLSSCGVDAHSHLTHLGEQFVSAVDDGRNHFSGHQHLVAPDGARHQNIIHCTHTEQVVGVHDQRILCDTFPHAQVACLFPVDIGQRRFGACAVGVHDVTVFGVSTQNVGYDFTESLWKDTLVDILYGVVDILLGGRYSTHHVAVM